MSSFEGENMQTQYNVLSYIIAVCDKKKSTFIKNKELQNVNNI